MRLMQLFKQSPGQPSVDAGLDHTDGHLTHKKVCVTDLNGIVQDRCMLVQQHADMQRSSKNRVVEALEQLAESLNQ